jgi:hypothetical protein
VRLTLAVLAALVAAAWAGLLVAAPMVAAQGASEPYVYGAAWVYRAGSLVCHQQHDRSFAVRGMQVPVCARCAGLYAGAGLGAAAALAWAVASRRRTFAPPGVPLAAFRRVAVACAVPTAAAWAAEHGAGLDVPNLARALFALPLGAVVASIVTLWAANVRFHDRPPATAIH